MLDIFPEMYGQFFQTCPQMILITLQLQTLEHSKLRCLNSASLQHGIGTEPYNIVEFTRGGDAFDYDADGDLVEDRKETG